MDNLQVTNHITYSAELTKEILDTISSSSKEFIEIYKENLNDPEMLKIILLEEIIDICDLHPNLEESHLMIEARKCLVAKLISNVNATTTCLPQ